MMIAVKSWVEQMTERGVRLYGGPLRSAAEANIGRVRDGEMLVCDGPFAETKRSRSEATTSSEYATLDAAVRLVAKSTPLARTAAVEIEPLWDAPWNHWPAGAADVHRGPPGSHQADVEPTVPWISEATRVHQACRPPRRACHHRQTARTGLWHGAGRAW